MVYDLVNKNYYKLFILCLYDLNYYLIMNYINNQNEQKYNILSISFRKQKI